MVWGSECEWSVEYHLILLQDIFHKIGRLVPGFVVAGRGGQ